MNIPRNTETSVMEAFTAAPSFTVTKTIHVRIRITEWPAMMFAKSLIIRANGLVNNPIISMAGMIGIGAFNQVGTSGQRISFQ